MSRLIEYRTAVVTSLKDSLPALKHVAPSAGVFGIQMIERLTVRLPAALVSVLQSKATKRNNVGQFIGPVTSAVYCIAHDPYKSQAWAPAIDLAEAVADHIELNAFGLNYVAAARVRDIDVLYSKDLDDQGVCVAAVLFTQEITFGRNRHREEELAGVPLGDIGELEEWPEDLGL
jgi:hypothetical protein